ncbi:MAG: tetratricopeptide repeat protein [Candidatus Marinimicrobia bacterium]|jgi:tetratricopeptide (TPR) repeat protein|nr:tetratricopeptide repeat protein [Candidatus Neomarinimicrobiota bacterium]MBT5340118.1 tetratricopeptide repeat protein [Candidatus Neomarinimicrobiota bacterium]
MKMILKIIIIITVVLTNSHGSENNLTQVYTLIDSAKYYTKQLQFDQAISAYQKVSIILKENENQHYQLLADIYRKTGKVYRTIKKDDLFLQSILLSSEILKKNLGDEHQKVAESYNNIGTAYFEIGEYEKALDYYEKTLIVEFKQDTPKVNICYNNIGTTYTWT